ncbi:hypothetical protein PCASD_20288 [Puccinia coronata f. sp. avenae]|uniref:Uncharacterized protein n=2 Tax=Puccinia coronata f. sp. avenae TaxID=200324 RepID=A0A2N5T8Q4_9BASI|nr:hypothetical protein PCASD_20288 [Puccinia coronata f. sp. avenae]
MTFKLFFQHIHSDLGHFGPTSHRNSCHQHFWLRKNIPLNSKVICSAIITLNKELSQLLIYPTSRTFLRCYRPIEYSPCTTGYLKSSRHLFSFSKLTLNLYHKDKLTLLLLSVLYPEMEVNDFICDYVLETTAKTQSDFPKGTLVKTRAKKKKAATLSVTAPTSQEATAASDNMDVDQRARSSATPMPMTPQPAVRPVDALGQAANALPSIPPANSLPTAPPPPEKDWDQGLTPEEKARYRQDLNWPTTNGPQQPGGNNPVPPIESLDEEAQIALIMLNTHYNSYVGANNCRQFAVTEMHLRQCISAQETLRSQVGDAMTITLSQGWSAKYQLAKLKEWMRVNLPRNQNPPSQSLTPTANTQSRPIPGEQANSASYTPYTVAQAYQQPNQQEYPANQAPGYYPQATTMNHPAEAAPPFQEPYEQNHQQHRSQAKRGGRGWRASNNAK